MFHWRLHRALMSGREPEVNAWLKQCGDDVQWVDGPVRDLPAPSVQTGQGGLALTTLQDAMALYRGRWASQGSARRLYFSPTRYHVSQWLGRYAEDLPVLNAKGFFTQAGAIARLPGTPVGLDMENGFFLRPDSGLKPFTGATVTPTDRPFQSWGAVAAAAAGVLHGQDPERMIYLSPLRALHEFEWRFWIVRRQVAASTPYAWESEPAWEAPPAEAVGLADAVARHPWQPDIAYVLDLSLDMIRRRWYINEINAASTSGLYAAPVAPLFEALRAAVLAENAGNIAIGD